jgi:hypothetical protein
MDDDDMTTPGQGGMNTTNDGSSGEMEESKDMEDKTEDPDMTSS